MSNAEKTSKRQTYYFTFGFGHLHPNGYVAIHDVTDSEARAWMFSMTGNKWAFQYDEEQKDILEKWNMKLIKEFHRKDLPAPFVEREEQPT